jgi:hypothetical protein
MTYWVEFENASLNGTYVYPYNRFSYEDRSSDKPYSSYEGRDFYTVDKEKVHTRIRNFCKEKFGVEPIDISTLPYGAGKLLNEEEGVDSGGFFCFSPNSCKGRSSCPRPYACSE